ncbi:hypothetical protein C8Q70DRAFT_1051974 [Cubamyces menziesii]|uniref:DUF6534 domain-containing protein n=1 Tax=Trametes cubensis TaxID=1111947 RepID=A0AAD7XFU4_9APHY|nr:hypothetical protein C8Q70DRAFT_1051974 [Cubamyces menziesii]KAJ8495941.1 hypothetical protein ONZ51_g1407 [Trametes cubensis]
MADVASTSLDTTIGVIFVGFLFTGCLFGVTSAQSTWYFRHYPNDRHILKLLVRTIWVLDAVHLGLYGATMFTYLVQKQAANSGQNPLPWTSNVQLLCNAFAIAIIQSFYALRIWTLSKQRILLAVMITFIVATWAFSVVLFIKTLLTKTVAQFVLLTPFDIALSVMSASTDGLLCGALVVLLCRSRTGTTGANRLINKLMLYTVHTSLLTSIYAILSVIMVLVSPMSSWFVMFYYIGARLYSVSVLATLNAREGLRVQAEKMGQLSLPEIQITSPSVPKQSSAARSRTPDGIVVSMSSNTTSTLDKSVSTSASRLHCDGDRCYMMPSQSLSDLRMEWPNVESGTVDFTVA